VFRCQLCGEEIIYVECAGEIVSCEPKLTEIITEKGNLIRGHKKHICSGDENVRGYRNDKENHTEMSS